MFVHTDVREKGKSVCGHTSGIAAHKRFVTAHILDPCPVPFREILLFLDRQGTSDIELKWDGISRVHSRILGSQPDGSGIFSRWRIVDEGGGSNNGEAEKEIAITRMGGNFLLVLVCCSRCSLSVLFISLGLSISLVCMSCLSVVSCPCVYSAVNLL